MTSPSDPYVDPTTPTVKGMKPPVPKPQADGTLKLTDKIFHLEEDFSARAQAAYEGCKQHLRTGIFDWVVSDGDTEAVMKEFAPLGFAETIALVHKLGEHKDGSTNLLAKFYDRGLESREQITRWRKLMHDKLLSASNEKGQIPDLNVKLAEYQTRYVPANILQRGF